MSLRLIVKSLIVAAAFAGLQPGAPAVAAESPVGAFYEGKQVSLLIGYPPGGGYDAYARLVARHLGRHIPCHPTVVPSNMPGAGSIILANHLYNRAAKDGTVIGMVTGDAALNPLFGLAEAHFDSLKLSWIGSVNKETSICLAWHTAPIKSIDDVFHRDFIVGTSSSTGTTFSYPTSSNALLGTKFKIVSGYEGTNGVWLAIERGEVEGVCGTPWNSIRSGRPQWIRDKLITVILQEATTRNPDLPDVPTVMDIAKTDEQKRVLELIYGWQIMGRPLVAPPGLPPDRFAALRQAFDATMQDADFRAEAVKMMLDVNPLTGAEIDAFLARVFQTPRPLIERAAAALGRTDR